MVLLLTGDARVSDAVDIRPTIFRMLSESELLELLEKHRPRDVTRLGRSVVRNVIEDFVALGERRDRRPAGGHQFDHAATIGILVGALQLFVAVTDIVVREIRLRKERDAQTLIEIVKPKIETLDLSAITDQERLIRDIIEIAGRHDD